LSYNMLPIKVAVHLHCGHCFSKLPDETIFALRG